jgi:hypothetical protein
MKPPIKIAYYLFFILLIISCSGDDDGNDNEGCFFCENTALEYCYTYGDDFYTVGAQGDEMNDDCDGDEIPDYLDPDPCKIPLDDQSWEEIREQLESDC